MRYILVSILAVVALFAQDDNATTRAKQLYLNNGCSSCHGLYGEGIGSAPRLQGKPAALLKERLTRLKAGKTRTPDGTVMVSFAKNLTDTQIELLSRWLSTLKKEEETQHYELDNFFDNTGDGSS